MHNENSPRLTSDIDKKKGPGRVVSVVPVVPVHRKTNSTSTTSSASSSHSGQSTTQKPIRKCVSVYQLPGEDIYRTETGIAYEQKTEDFQAMHHAMKRVLPPNVEIKAHELPSNRQAESRSLILIDNIGAPLLFLLHRLRIQTSKNRLDYAIGIFILFSNIVSTVEKRLKYISTVKESHIFIQPDGTPSLVMQDPKQPTDEKTALQDLRHILCMLLAGKKIAEESTEADKLTAIQLTQSEFKLSDNPTYSFLFTLFKNLEKPKGRNSSILALQTALKFHRDSNRGLFEKPNLFKLPHDTALGTYEAALKEGERQHIEYTRTMPIC